MEQEPVPQFTVVESAGPECAPSLALADSANKALSTVSLQQITVPPDVFWDARKNFSSAI